MQATPDVEYAVLTIQAVSDALARRSAVRSAIDGEVVMDMQTANAIVTVYDNLRTEESKAKLETMLRTHAGIDRCARICWSLVVPNVQGLQLQAVAS